MRLTVDGLPVFAATGGRAFDPARPTVVFLHGADSTHHFWVLQTRALAFDDWNVLAPDMPGHCSSGGAPLQSVSEMSDWVIRLLDAAGSKRAVVVGHSLGGLIALEVAAKHPHRVGAVVLVGSAVAIPVNAALIDTAQRDPGQARELMAAWSYGPAAHLHENTWPGASHIFTGLEIARRNRPETLAIDLQACADYGDGPQRAKSLEQPCLCIVAGRDRMVPMKSGLKSAELLAKGEIVAIAGAGHNVATEKPREVNAALRKFLAAHRQALVLAT
jgi:pimeloyl-ACP methyl ester carboxylesterase